MTLDVAVSNIEKVTIKRDEYGYMTITFVCDKYNIVTEFVTHNPIRMLSLQRIKDHIQQVLSHPHIIEHRRIISEHRRNEAADYNSLRYRTNRATLSQVVGR